MPPSRKQFRQRLHHHQWRDRRPKSRRPKSRRPKSRRPKSRRSSWEACALCPSQSHQLRVGRLVEHVFIYANHTWYIQLLEHGRLAIQSMHDMTTATTMVPSLPWHMWTAVTTSTTLMTGTPPAAWNLHTSKDRWIALAKKILGIGISTVEKSFSMREPKKGKTRKIRITNWRLASGWWTPSHVITISFVAASEDRSGKKIMKFLISRMLYGAFESMKKNNLLFKVLV